MLCYWKLHLIKAQWSGICDEKKVPNFYMICKYMLMHKKLIAIDLYLI